MNRLFVAYKPVNISSNAFLHTLKKKYKVQKAGNSGTLDPFAKGVLIVAFGAYTRLFRFLSKTPKKQRFLNTGGKGWIRTTEVTDDRFTVCSLWPLGKPSICSFQLVGAGGRT